MSNGLNGKKVVLYAHKPGIKTGPDCYLYGTVHASMNNGSEIIVDWKGTYHVFDTKTGKCTESSSPRMGDFSIYNQELSELQQQQHNLTPIEGPLPPPPPPPDQAASSKKQTVTPIEPPIPPPPPDEAKMTAFIWAKLIARGDELLAVTAVVNHANMQKGRVRYLYEALGGK